MRLQREKIFAEITIREAERKRIATDLHDNLGPLLSAVKLNISSVDIDNAGDREVMDKTAKHLDEIIGSMRQISYDLLPATLERKGLVEAIREFVSSGEHETDDQYSVIRSEGDRGSQGKRDPYFPDDPGDRS